MAAGDTLRRISPNDQFILDWLGNLVGVKNPNASGGDLNLASGTLGMKEAYDGSFNWTPAKLPYLAAAIAKARTSPPTSTSAIATIDLIGDSTTYYAPLNGAAYLRTNAWGTRLAKHLVDLGIPALEDSINGAGAFTLPSDVVATDARVAFGAGWVLQAQGTMGGKFFKCPNTVVTAMSFTPTNAFDTIEVEYLALSGLGNFTVDIGGAVLQTVNTNAGTAILRAKVPTGAGAAAGTVNVKGNSTGDVFIMGITTRNSTARKVEVCNFGWPQSTSLDWSSTSLQYGPLARIAARASAATAICLGVNDWNSPGNTPLATYTANIQSLITQAKLTGDVILIAPPQSNSANLASTGVQQTFVDALKTLAASNNCAYLDMPYRFGTWANASARGLMDDDRHPNAIGADSWGYRMAQLMASI